MCIYGFGILCENWIGRRWCAVWPKLAIGYEYEYQPESNMFSLVIETNQPHTHTCTHMRIHNTHQRHKYALWPATNGVLSRRIQHTFATNWPLCPHVSISVSQSNQFGHKITVIFFFVFFCSNEKITVSISQKCLLVDENVIMLHACSVKGKNTKLKYNNSLVKLIYKVLQ